MFLECPKASQPVNKKYNVPKSSKCPNDARQLLGEDGTENRTTKRGESGGILCKATTKPPLKRQICCTNRKSKIPRQSKWKRCINLVPINATNHAKNKSPKEHPVAHLTVNPCRYYQAAEIRWYRCDVKTWQGQRTINISSMNECSVRMKVSMAKPTGKARIVKKNKKKNSAVDPSAHRTFVFVVSVGSA